MNAERDQNRPKNLARFLFSFGRIVLGMADDELRRGHEFRAKTLSHAEDRDKPALFRFLFALIFCFRA